MSLNNVAKRLSMTLYQVRRIKSDDINDPEEPFKRRTTKSRFDKLHERARGIIKECLEQAERPVHLRDIQTVLLKKC